MDEDDFYDDDEPYYGGPYVIVDKARRRDRPPPDRARRWRWTGALLAPQSGEETRQGIVRRARRAQEAAQDLVEDVSGVVVDKFKDVRASVEERIEATLDSVDDKRRQRLERVPCRPGRGS